MDPYIGKLLDNRYEILDVLGTGGMAVVYRAYCHRLNRYVAVKILKSELAADDDLRRRFHDESQAVAMLSHPNIVAIYDVSQVDGREFIVMELIDGITLKQYMHKRGGCLNWREALHFINQIMQALKHAHSRGIIHRDIKPQNVMVLRDGSVKVMDFGIARSTTSQATMTQETIGSVHYISPEQARGSHIDIRSDIYSAGVVLYEMLTGRLPYEGDNPVSVAIQHINSIPIAPRELNPEVPLGLEQITLKAMASVPDRRYANADEMLLDLEDFRKNPEIDFGYSAPGVVVPEVDEPTMVRRGGLVDTESDSDATVRQPVAGRPVARFEREERYPERERSRYDDEEEDDEEEGRKSRRYIGIIIGVAAIVLVVFVILFFTLLHNGSGSDDAYYIVPNLVGDTLEEAQAVLDADEDLQAHFSITVGEYQESEYDAGVIIAQDPLPNHSTQEDVTVITVTVSSGPADTADEIVLEDYTGQDYRLVKSQLDALGLNTTCTAEYSDTVDELAVIRTDPVAGATLTEGDSITIYYSQGPEIKSQSMINLIGLTEADARSNINNMGLDLELVVESEYNDEYGYGYVCYQSIPVNATIQQGDTLTIRVSLGSEPVEEDPEEDDPGTTSTTQWVITVNLPSDRTEAVTVEITVNESLIYRGTVDVGTDEVTVDFEGDVISSYSVKVNGEEYNDFDLIKQS